MTTTLRNALPPVWQIRGYDENIFDIYIYKKYPAMNARALAQNIRYENHTQIDVITDAKEVRERGNECYGTITVESVESERKSYKDARVFENTGDIK